MHHLTERMVHTIAFGNAILSMNGAYKRTLAANWKE